MGELTPAMRTDVWDRLGRLLRPHVEVAILAERRRREAAIADLREYEREHGLITQDEVDDFLGRWQSPLPQDRTGRVP